MIVNNVDLYSYNDAVQISLAFQDPDSSQPYQVRAIDGLDADEIIPRFTGNPVDTSGIGFYTPALAKREIVIVLGMNPYLEEPTTYSKLREDMYKLIAGSRTGSIKIYFNNDEETVAAITGFVTKMEATLFEKAPALQLTIDCSRDPLLKALTPITVSPTGLIVDGVATVNDQLSTFIHGFRFAVKFTSPASSFKVSGESGWLFKVNRSFVIDDIIHISSETREKKVYKTHGTGSGQTHIADKIDDDSTWPVMLPGINEFQFTPSTGIQMSYLSYYPTYLGV